MDAFGNVYPTLLGCFLIILIGYVCGRASLISASQGKGVELYITRVALPALLFKSLVELDFSKVDWNFWFGILAAKAILFVIVASLTLLVSQPMSGNLGRAGLFAIFVTQSNDLALGLPLFDAIYKETHPEYVQYLYLLIPVSVALLNPIGFLMLEFHKNAKEKGSKPRKLKIIWTAVKGVISNPLVFMVIMGIVFNFVLNGTKSFTGFDRQHWFLSPFLSVVGNSFGATSLFYLGLNLVGNMKSLNGFTIIVPFLLVFCKSLIFPVIARQAVFWLHNNSSVNDTSLTSFAFIYGTLPTAPPVAVYSSMYGIHVDTIGTSMVLGTFLSAPIMFVSSKMIMVMSSESDEISRGFNKALFDTGILSTVCCLLLSLAMSLSINVSIKDGYHVLLAVFLIGLFGTTVWTTLVCYALTAVRCQGESVASRKKPIIFICGICFPLAIGISLAFTKAGSDLEISGLQNNASKVLNPFLEYINGNRYDKYCRCREMSGSDMEQLAISETAAEEGFRKSCSRCQTLCEKMKDIEDYSEGSSCCHQYDEEQTQKELYSHERDESQNPDSRKRVFAKKKMYGAVPTSDTGDIQYEALKDIEKITFEEYLQGDRHQLSRHVILVLFLCFFSVLNVFLCFERLKQNCQAHRAGIFLEIEFLAVTCTIGQGLLSFAIFGFNKIFFNLLSFERLGCIQPGCIAKKIQLEPLEYLDQTVKDICLRFRAHHLENCRKDLVSDLRFHFRSYKNVFRGDQMVDWIIEFGLANTRADAVFQKSAHRASSAINSSGNPTRLW
eukprot:gene14885-6021_t